MPSKTTSPVKKSKKTKAQKPSKTKTGQVKFFKESTDVLVIAPHGVNKKGVKRDDSRTDIVAATIADELGCSALINDSVSDDDKIYMAQHIAEMASKHNIQAATCSEALKLSNGIQKNKCVDDGLMRKAFNQDADLMRFLGL